MLSHLINAEMYYHAKALEKLSELTAQVNQIDEAKEIDVNLLKKI